jgi:pilus assembly protein FimV
MLKNQRLALSLALALGSADALALGLGGIEVKSKMNEPLDAEISIVSATPTELENLQVRLASPEMFARVGLDRPALVSANLDFSLGENAQGQPVIRVTSASRLRDPFLNFLLEVEYGRGRLLREYTVLLDPPATTRISSAPSATPPTASAPPPATAPALPPPEIPAPVAPAPAAPAPQATAPAPPVAPPPTRPAPVAAQPAPAAAPAPARAPAPAPAPAPTPASAAPDRVQVTGGQTLWSVAQQVRPQGVNTNQAMLALQRANPDAFINGNINRLKTGAVLRIPSRDEFAAMGTAEAESQVRAQEASWRGQPAPQPVAAAPAATTPAAAAASPRPAAPVDSRLEVVPPSGDTPRAAQSGAAAGAEGRELRAEVARAQEQVSALQQENRELQSRVTDLERIDRDTRQLIALKDSQLAEAQRRLAELEQQRQAAAAAPTATPTEPAADVAAPADATPAADDAVVTDDPDATSTASASAPSASAPSVAIDPATGDALPPPITEDEAPVLPARPARRDREPATTPVASATPPAPAPTPPRWYENVLVLGGLGVVLLGLLGLFGLLARRKREADWRPARGGFASGEPVVEAAPVVPVLAESSEEQRLLDDIGEQPDDLGRHLALVRFYYLERDASGFEGAAEAMYAQLSDPLDPDWQQVVRMGRDIQPDHPLFAQADDAEFVAALEDRPLHVADETPAPAADVEWTLPADQPASAEPDAPATGWATTASDWTPETSEPVAPAYDEEPIEAVSSEVDDDHAGDDYASEGGDDESAATKLELARAYLDMGDVEGARGMLEEVVGEGNPGQRSEARRLLDEIR